MVSCSFINSYLGVDLQLSGNQAVDDKFTVISYSQEDQIRTLPGVALDADPRLPFYQISEEIEKVSPGEGSRIDSYLQLKTCKTDALKGKILIDSPGFDADEQRNAILRLTDHIVDLSDLVLVFFDARHPEPGAMRDTLEHLVSKTIHRADSGKFLYILNQLDTTANEDNPEDVIAAWQRALGEHGLTAGRFYSIYSPTASIKIEDETMRARYEMKRDMDLDEIHGRMAQVEIERAYRIVGALEKTARDIEEKVVPRLRGALKSWRNRVLWGDGIAFGLLALVVIYFGLKPGQAVGTTAISDWTASLNSSATIGVLTLIGALIVAFAVHYGVRSLARKSLFGSLAREEDSTALRGDLVAAFRRATRPWRTIFSSKPTGWGRGTRKRLHQIVQDTDSYVQALNDRFTNPSGDEAPAQSVSDQEPEPAPAGESAKA